MRTLVFLLAFESFLLLGAARNFHFVNPCSDDVWVGTQGNPVPAGGGFRLNAGQTQSFSVAEGTTAARAWFQSGCSWNGNTPVNCKTCPDGSQCTLFEWTFTPGMDWIDISLVDGWSHAMKITTTAASQSGYNCGIIDCENLNCPAELTIKNSDGSFRGCINQCGAANNAGLLAAFPILQQNQGRLNDCCNRPASNACAPGAWPVSSTGQTYYNVFKNVCPTSYVFPSDDPTSMFTCSQSPDYTMTRICPSGAPPPPPPPATTTTTRAPTSPPAAGCSNTYHVQSGDTGYVIAQNHGMTFQTLSNLNPNVNWNSLQIGQSLCLSASSSVSSVLQPTGHVRCWGLGGGTGQTSAIDCANYCYYTLGSSCTTWSWAAFAGCWTGTAQTCNSDQGNDQNGNPQWFSGGRLVAQASQTATQESPSLVWFKTKGYWIVIAGVVLLVSLALVLFFTTRSRRRRGTLEAIPEKEMTTVKEQQQQQPSAQGYDKPASKWVPTKDDAGNTYYYNQETGASQWEVPDS